MHCASLNAASIHAAVSAAISDGIDSQLRFCARALLSLTCFLWGSFGAHPAKWSWVHLEHLLANPDPSVGSSPVGRVFATEVYMKNVALLRRLQPHCPTATLRPGDAPCPSLVLVTPPRHCSIRHYAKGSERDLMLHVYNLHVVARAWMGVQPCRVHRQAPERRWHVRAWWQRHRPVRCGPEGGGTRLWSE